MITLVLFDVDGTLLDTTEFIFQAFAFTLKKEGFLDVSREQIRPYIGKPLADCYIGLTGKKDVSKLISLHRDFQKKHLFLSVPFTNTLSVLETLKKQHILIVALTTRSNKTATSTLKRAGIFPFLDLLLTSEDVLKQKPDPEGIEKALRFLSVSKESAVMIGDTDVDIKAGKNAKVKTIGAAYGFHKNEIAKCNPEFVVSDIKDILPIISSLYVAV